MKRLTHSVRNSTCHIQLYISMYLYTYKFIVILSWASWRCNSSAPMRSLSGICTLKIYIDYLYLLFSFIIVIILYWYRPNAQNKKKKNINATIFCMALTIKRKKKKKLANINATTNNKNNENNSYKRLCEFLWKFSDTFGIVRWCLDRSVPTQRQSVIWPNGHAHNSILA